MKIIKILWKKRPRLLWEKQPQPNQLARRCKESFDYTKHDITWTKATSLFCNMMIRGIDFSKNTMSKNPKRIGFTAPLTIYLGVVTRPYFQVLYPEDTCTEVS